MLNEYYFLCLILLLSILVIFGVSFLLKKTFLPFLPTIIGITFSFLSLLSSCNLSFYLCYTLKWNRITFYGISCGLLLGILTIIRQFATDLRVKLSSTISMYQSLSVCILAAFIFLSNATYLLPSASGQFFQAAYPLYAKLFAQKGSFLGLQAFNFGEGFLASSMYYAPNSFGVVSLSTLFGITDLKQLYIVYDALHIVCAILTFGVIIQLLSTQVSIALFTFVSLLFGTLSRSYGIYYSNGGEEVLYLSAALCFYFIMRAFTERTYSSEGLPTIEAKKRFEALCSLSIIAGASMVFGRNYGLYYSLVLLLLIFFAEYNYGNTNKSWFNGKYFSSCLVLFLKKYHTPILMTTVYAQKELIQLYNYGPFYPRSKLTEILPYTFDSFIQGFFNAFGIASYSGEGFSFSLDSIIGIAFLVSLLLIMLSKKKKTMKKMAVIPLLIPLIPLSLELLTHYRKSALMSKLFVPFIFWSAWYVSYMADLISSELSGKPHLQRILLRTYCVLIISVLGLGSAHLYMQRSALFARPYFLLHNTKQLIQGTYHQYVDENEIVEKFRKTLTPKTFSQIQDRPILYFHYEPGLGMRIYLGGELQKDYDFWSETVQKKLSNSGDLNSFLRSLGHPTLVLYKNDPFLYQLYNHYEIPEWFKKELSDIIEKETYGPVYLSHNITVIPGISQ